MEWNMSKTSPHRYSREEIDILLNQLRPRKGRRESEEHCVNIIQQLLDDREKLLDRIYEYKTHLEIDGELPTALERVNRTIKEVTGDE